MMSQKRIQNRDASEIGTHISDIFDLLEPLSAALVETGGPDIRTGFARATGGVDIPFIIEALVRNKQHSSDMVERQRALSFMGGSALVTKSGSIELVFKDDDLDYCENGYRTLTVPASERLQIAQFLGLKASSSEVRCPTDVESGGDA